MRKLILAAVIAALPMVAQADSSLSNTGHGLIAHGSLSSAARAMAVNRTAAMLRLSMKQLDQDRANGAPAETITQDEASVRERKLAFRKAANLD